MSSKDVTAAQTGFCAIRPTADNDPNLEDPRYAISKFFAKANGDSLDQIVDHFRSTCRIIKERWRSYAATVNTSRNALRKEERRPQLAAAGAAMAETETASPLVNQLPPKRIPTAQRSWMGQCGKMKAHWIG